MATLKDIAEIANVSVSTVSRVLNYDQTLSVSDQTRENVFKAAEELNYKKLKSKSDLQKKKKEELLIGIIEWYSMSEELSDPYYLSIRSGIERACFERKIQIKTIFKEDGKIHMEQLSEVDSIIAIGKYSQKEVKMFSSFTQNIVFVDSCPNDHLYDSVVVDFYDAMENVIEYLINNGHKDIAFLGGKEFVGDDQEELIDPRESAFINILSNKNLLNKDLIVNGPFNVESGYNLAKKIIEKGDFTAIFIASDSMAVGAIRAFNELDFKIPEDISIVGFNDIPTAEYLMPPLTTVKVYTEYMGRTAVEKILSKINFDRIIPQKTVIPTELVERESVLEI
jgi:LacI family transcriptional regulator